MQPQAGQVWTAASSTSRRLVFLFAIAPDFVQIALLHSFPELATDKDLLLAPALTTLPYLLVVQTDLVSPLLASQLHTHLATLPASIVAACFPAADLRAFKRGLPLQGRSDARWDWKLEELASLHALARAALQRLLD